MKFFTADLHLFHDNIIGYCDRPFDNTSQMWSQIKKNWNAVVGNKDEVWVVGDLTLKGPSFVNTLKEMITSLNGTKHMIVAPTHDVLSPWQYEYLGFSTVHYPAIKLENGWYVGHDPALATLWPRQSVYICGHVHKLMTSDISDTNVLMINVGVDVRNFTPVSEQQIQEIIDHGEPKSSMEEQDTEKSSGINLQNEGGGFRIQSRRNLRNGKNQQTEVQKERWESARRASINGGSQEERDRKDPDM